MPTSDCEILKTFPCACASGDRCAVASAHARLREAHRHWHEALHRYSDLDGMRTYLNGTVQALRNVTFTLQAAKSRIPGFDAWYAEWQEEYRKDPVMRWAVNSRNRIVKDADLETRSVAKVDVVGSADGEIVMEVEAAPSVSNRALAAALMRKLRPTENLLRGGLLRVERRWVDSNLPEVEVLDALAHVFGRLAALLIDCHRVLRLDEDCRWLPHDRGEAAGPRQKMMPPCMIAFEDRRSAWLRMLDGSQVEIQINQVRLDPAGEERARTRYREDSRETFRLAVLASTLEERAGHLLAVAKMFMETDGFYVPMAFLFRGPELLWQGVLHFPNNAFKHLQWDNLRRQVLRTGATEIAVVSEGWKASLNPKVPDLRAEDAPDRRETLSVDILNSKGESFTLLSMVERVDGKAVVRPPEKLEMMGYYLDPVRQAWGLPPTPEQSPT
ncbi:MAG TPA: hypothetical protein VD997_04975 [Phycisphaerales bacterium]|nr:hypothetical protein [Phycisphaerales bacterium]